MTVRRAAFAILALVPACFDPRFSATRCGQDDSCPTGLVCRGDGMCGAGAPPDATSEVDASVDAGFDAALCPASYNVQLPGPSRYRLILEGGAAWMHSDDCDDDLPGATHLVVFESLAELVEVNALHETTDELEDIWIGGVQQRSARLPADEWLSFDGAPLMDGWDAGEPNDDTVEDLAEQFAEMQKGRRYFNDTEGSEPNDALCECDGKSVAPNARAAITSNRPPPP
jgi:hypothetical protein